MNDTPRTSVALVNMVENYREFGVSSPAFAEKDRRDAISVSEAVGAEVVSNELVCDAQTATDFVSSACKTSFDALVMNVIGWSGGDSALVIGRALESHPLMSHVIRRLHSVSQTESQ
jgi:hypothetical protein